LRNTLKPFALGGKAYEPVRQFFNEFVPAEQVLGNKHPSTIPQLEFQPDLIDCPAILLASNYTIRLFPRKLLRYLPATIVLTDT